MFAQQPLRTALIVVAAIFAVAVPIGQSLGYFGLSASEFSDDGNTTLRAAGYAFSIWSVIYLGLLAYAAYQAISPSASPSLLDRFGWPSIIAITGCGLWLLAAGADAKWATVAIITVSALALIVPLLQGTRGPSRDRWLIVVPLALLAGWLTVASAVNLLTVLTATGNVPDASATLWAIGGIVVTFAIAAAVTLLSTSWVYAVPIAWGLVAIFVAEQGRRPEAAWTALACAGALLVIAALAQRRNAPLAAQA